MRTTARRQEAMVLLALVLMILAAPLGTSYVLVSAVLLFAAVFA